MSKKASTKAAHVLLPTSSRLVHLIFLVTRSHGGNQVWPGDRDARAVFEHLKKNPAIAGKMQSPTDVAEAQRLWNRCRADPRKKRIVHYRDKYVAHYGQPELSEPQFRELFGFARATVSAIEKLAHGTGGVRVSHRSQLKDRKASAKKFWDLLARP